MVLRRAPRQKPPREKVKILDPNVPPGQLLPLCLRCCSLRRPEGGCGFTNPLACLSARRGFQDLLGVGMQQPEGAGTRGCHNHTSSEACQNTATKPTRLTSAISLGEELIVQKRDLVIADLLDAKMGSQALL